MDINSSVAAIYISVGASITFYLTLRAKKGPVNIACTALVFAATIVITYLGARAAIGGLVLSIFYQAFIYYQSNRFFHSKKRFAAITIAGLFTGFLFIKSHSTLGRWFIWQRCGELLVQNWQTGVGWGRFNVAYNHHQAAYFQTHSRISSEALRANDGYYAFNEWLHIMVETGLPGFLLLAGLIAFVIVRFKAVNKRNLLLSMSVLIPIFTASLVSYPFHDAVLLGLTFIGVGHFFLKPLNNYLAFIIWGAGAAFCAFSLVQQNKLQESLNKVSVLSQTGYGKEAQETLEALLPTHSYNPQIGLSYLTLLYNTAEYKSFYSFYKEHHTFHCNQKIHALLAKACEESGNNNEAEQHYLTSIYITPHLLGSRWNIVRFYHQQNEVVKARYWAKELLACPVKNPNNQQALNLKQKAKEYLLKGSID